MSTKENVVVSEVSEVPNNHHAAAEERILELRRMRELIPRFFIPASPQDAQRLHSAASVSPEFVELTVVAMTHQKNALARADSIPPAEIRDLMSYGEAYSPLADELEALAQFVRISVAAARNTAGSEALTTYALAQRLAKRPETAGLAPFVADMRRALGRGRKPSPDTVAKREAAKAEKAAEKAQKAANKAAKAAAPQTTQQTTE